MECDLIPTFLFVHTEGEVVGRLHCFHNGGLVEVEVDVVKSTAYIKELVPLLVP